MTGTSPLPALDRALYSLLTRGWRPEQFEQYLDVLPSRPGLPAVPPVVFRTFEAIDAKAAALLTYTSMMVAALGVTSALVAESRSEEAVIVVEIVIYLVISILSLRCISLFREPSEFEPDELPNLARDELILRRGLFSFCNRAAIYLTIAVLVSLPLLFFI